MEKIGFVYAITAAVTWGLAYTLDQKILEKASPVLLLLFNSVIALIIFLPVAWFTGDLRRSFSFDSETLFLVLIAQLLTLIGTLFILAGIKLLGASLASIFEIMYPFFVILFSYLIFGTSVNYFFWIGSGLLFLGSAILIRFA